MATPPTRALFRHPDRPRRQRDPVEEETGATIREYMARTGPKGERLTRAQTERLRLSKNCVDWEISWRNWKRKQRPMKQRKIFPELDDHLLKRLYQALMLPLLQRMKRHGWRGWRTGGGRWVC